ncbi:DUF4189 domain-containing protein [Roseomonas stagni]|uniref:DUF4189 domain-containing protein n=1 Tax=Falsiroseomonas algicola TaxID=2716930 RepID=A0A6M1LPY6_9PROT|nr:DUF4189 domain-containing protein [Falsiroseomonas algicola]NGM22456.1 DUF4189 domain-containing protein [Falsiroseomonas algicola]
MFTSEGAGLARLSALLCLITALWLPVPASAQSGQANKPVDSMSCRRQCDARMPERAMNPQPVQACLVRCAAGERHLSRQNQRGTPEATGRGSSAPSTSGAMASARPGVAAGVPNAMPQRSAAAGRSIVAYAAPLPGRGLSISMPQERMAAHRGAETECFRRNNNNPCRLLAETADRCLAIAYGIRATGLVITSDPRTFTIHHYGTGSGADETSAEFAALRDCSGRLAAGVSCRIATSRCG